MLSPTRPTYSDKESSQFSFSERQALIVLLTERVEARRTAGLPHRAAIRATAAEAGLTAMAVKRMIDLYPEA